MRRLVTQETQTHVEHNFRRRRPRLLFFFFVGEGAQIVTRNGCVCRGKEARSTDGLVSRKKSINTSILSINFQDALFLNNTLFSLFSRNTCMYINARARAHVIYFIIFIRPSRLPLRSVFWRFLRVRNVLPVIQSLVLRLIRHRLFNFLVVCSNAFSPYPTPLALLCLPFSLCCFSVFKYPMLESYVL